MKRIKLFFAAFMLLKVASAQTEDYVNKLVNVLPLSPNTASLGKYGNVPVGNYTGVANVNVPIYTIETGNLKIPLTLNYHTGGVKVEDIASWVGTNWAFSFGGTITRQIRGGADEGGGGYLGTNNLIGQFDSWSLQNKELYIADVKNGLQDSQNDIFSYSFGNQTGKFFFKPDGEIVTKPRASIRFEFGTFDGRSGFKVVNADGVIYYFLDREESTNYASTLPPSEDQIGPVSAMSAWYISKIVSPQGEELAVFEYDLEPVIYEGFFTQTLYLNDIPTSDNCGKLPMWSRNSSSVLSVKLKKIKFPNGEIVITTMAAERGDLPGAHALESIQIKNSQGREIKRFDFTYNTTSNVSASKRLFLDEIRISANAVSLGAYRFEYINPYLLPDRDSKNQDFWGYYNGANNSNLIPHFVLTKTSGVVATYTGANRTPNPVCTKFGTLKRIYYPTGGYSEFDMENNTASNLLSVIERGYDMIGKSNRFQIFGDGSGLQTIYNGSFSVTNDFGGSGGVMARIQVGLPNSSSMPPPPTGDEDPLIQLTKPNGQIILLRNNVPMFLEKGNYTLHVDFTSNPDPALIRDFYVIIDYEYGVIDDPEKLKNLVVGGLRVQSIKDVDPISGNTVQRSFQYLKDDGATSTGLLGSFPAFLGKMKTCSQLILHNYVETYECGYITLGAISQSSHLLTQNSSVGYGMVDEFIDNGNKGKTRYFYTTFADFNDQGDFKEYPYPPSDSRDEFRGILLREQAFKKVTNTYGLVSEKSYKYNFAPLVGYSGLDPLLVVVPGLTFRQFYYPGACGYLNNLTPLHTVSQFNTKSGSILLLSDTARTFDQYDPNKYLEVVNTYEYSLKNLQVNKVASKKSNGDITEINYRFPLDYNYTIPATDNKVKGVAALVDKHMINVPIETSNYISSNGGALQLVSSNFVAIDPVTACPGALFTLDNKGPVNDFAPSVIQSNTMLMDSRYTPKIAFNKYLSNGRLVQQQKINDVLKSYLWDYNGSYAIAEITNADVEQVAYTSFETDDLGRWSLNAGSSFLTNNGNVTGKRSLSGGVNATVPQGSYILSLWSSTSPVVNGQPVSAPPRRSAGTGELFYQLELTNISSVNVSGGNIDEIRLYPKGAEMTTITYEPLVGVTSQSDVRGNISYYDYDGAGRLSVIRNEAGEVIKSFNYHYITQ
jgi:YD repeat-containing protein